MYMYGANMYKNGEGEGEGEGERETPNCFLVRVQPDGSLRSRPVDNPIPLARYGMTATTIGHEVVVFGGYDWGKSSFSSDVDIYNTRTGQWRKVVGRAKALWPVARTEHSAFEDGGRLTILGGYNSDSVGLSDVWSLDIKTGVWEQRHKAPLYMCAAGCLDTGDSVHFFGNVFAGYRKSHMTYVKGTAKWRIMPDLPFDVLCPAVAQIGDYAVIAGGYGHDTEVHAYQLSTAEWEEWGQYPMPQQVIYGRAVVLDLPDMPISPRVGGKHGLYSESEIAQEGRAVVPAVPTWERERDRDGDASGTVLVLHSQSGTMSAKIHPVVPSPRTVEASLQSVTETVHGMQHSFSAEVVASQSFPVLSPPQLAALGVVQERTSRVLTPPQALMRTVTDSVLGESTSEPEDPAEPMEREREAPASEGDSPEDRGPKVTEADGEGETGDVEMQESESESEVGTGVTVAFIAM
ncbi:hypothetical protein KIPB_007099 [Kipferlia bialata]|uniref:Uncharacterized protein n=1 Tax=Kipferlia bialata TaxID=797122 RepID=A0A9K3CY26_9EUKA|nr:hypothetical protein KIPB_007099 [Kipferlia bialata]|eukprot:g7099.t1